MAIKRRRKVVTVAGTSESIDIGLGAAYARVLRVEIKGDDANVDAGTTFAITDAEGRLVLTAGDMGDAGRDDSTTKRTSQVYSTVGEGYSLVYDEALTWHSAGALATDNVGGGPLIATSPVTVALASAVDGDAFEITLFVEV